MKKKNKFLNNIRESKVLNNIYIEPEIRLKYDQIIINKLAKKYSKRRKKRF